MSEHAKIRFTYENADGGIEVETMWAVERGDAYEIDNVPFRVTSLAVGDLVTARQDNDGVLSFAKMIKASGHSTIQILFAHEKDVEAFRAQLAQMGCQSEISDLPELIAVDIPPAVRYAEVKRLLDDGESEGRFEYQEACLGAR